MPVEERTEEQRGKADADSRVTAEERDSDADETDVGDLDVEHAEPVVPAEDVDRAGRDPRTRPRSHREDEVSRDADASVTRSLGVEADGSHFVAERRPVQDQIEDERAAIAMKMPTCSPAARPRPRTTAAAPAGRGRRRSGSTCRRVLQGPVASEEIARPPVRDPVEHDRRDHLVGAGGRLEEAGDRPRGAPAREAIAIAKRMCWQLRHLGNRRADVDPVTRRRCTGPDRRC